MYVASAGVVLGARPNGGYGNWIQIDHPEKLSTVYAHLSRFAPGLKAGVPVRRGELIGFVGSTGPALDGTIVPMTTAIGLARILCLVPHRVLVPKS